MLLVHIAIIGRLSDITDYAPTWEDVRLQCPLVGLGLQVAMFDILVVHARGHGAYEAILLNLSRAALEDVRERVWDDGQKFGFRSSANVIEGKLEGKLE